MSAGPTRRQAIALGGAVASAALIGPGAVAQQANEPLKIGAVFPSRSGLGRVLTSINDFIGDGGRQGSLLAEQRVGDQAAAAGYNMTVLQASSPTPAAAVRAAERLIEFDGVDALLGGVGDGQLEALLPIAEANRIPLFNIGTPDQIFRQSTCSRYVFHMDASDAMYLDAMVIWSAALGHRRWFIVHEDDDRGRLRQMTAVRSIEKHGQGGEAVGAAATVPEQPVYFGEIDRARAADADAILLILSSVDQIAFFGQLDAVRSPAVPIPFPDPTSQTRDYVLALRQITRGYTPTSRFQLWDPGMPDARAAEFNEIYLTRFAAPADPAAWASYHAVKAYFEGVVATGGKDAEAIISYLEDPEVEFDFLKGPGTSFRPWDHQLRQPLYGIEIDVDLVLEEALVGAQLISQIAVAQVDSVLPPGGPGDNPTAWLDQLGDAEPVVGCNL